MPDRPPGIVARTARRILFTMLGGLLTIVGAVMLFLPPLPGLIVTAAGLGLLATEYAWAARLRERTLARFRRRGDD